MIQASAAILEQRGLETVETEAALEVEKNRAAMIRRTVATGARFQPKTN